MRNSRKEADMHVDYDRGIRQSFELIRCGRWIAVYASVLSAAKPDKALAIKYIDLMRRSNEAAHHTDEYDPEDTRQHLVSGDTKRHCTVFSTSSNTFQNKIFPHQVQLKYLLTVLVNILVAS